MSFQKTPGGTRGGRGMPSNAVTRFMSKTMTSWHRRSGDKFQGMDLLYLTTRLGTTTSRRIPIRCGSSSAESSSG